MSDRIAIQCNECGCKLTVPVTAAGKRARCPRCQTAVAIPAATSPATLASSPVQPVPVKRSGTGTVSRSAKTDADSAAVPGQVKKRNGGDPLVKDRDTTEASDRSGIDVWDSYGDQDAPQALPPRRKARVVTQKETRPKETRYEPTVSAVPRRPFGFSLNGPIITGTLMMVGAAIWFFVGLAAGYIFFYPPVLFVLGLVSFVKGLFGGE